MDPPGLGVPVAVVADDLELVPDADDADELELELEPPHAVTTAAIRTRQAAKAASLLQRMASLIPGLSSSCSLFAGAAMSQNGSSIGQRGADVNTIVNDLVARFGPSTPVEWRPCTDRQLLRFP
jgi:hypothetical protein